MIGGVYVYRTRKPWARFRIPLVSYHFAYVGESSSFWHRNRQHIMGMSSFGSCAPKDWADLEPRVAFKIRLPNWRWLRRSVETIAILAVWPVYNVQKNRWNPRRIKPTTARKQRRMRNAGLRLAVVRPAHIVLILAGFVALWLKIGGAW
jgi:hypothetical protein